MLRTAERIAEMERAEGIVTGDSLGKKSSQRLHTFRMQDEAVKDYPIHRPLLGLNTHSIREIAQRIGLEKTAVQKVKNKVEAKEKTQITSMKLEDIRQVEKEVNLEEMVEETLQSIKVLQL
jgi:thiamine biosynthesis protein ThiI